MTAFAEDFRAEIADEYDSLLNNPSDGLAAARRQGMSALVGWIQRRLVYDIRVALEMANPGDIERACARGALALLMLRDANHAMSAMMRDAFDGPEGEREKKLGEVYEAHARRLRDVEVPGASFQTMLVELAHATGSKQRFTIDVDSIGNEVVIVPHGGEERRFSGATLVSAVSDAHAAIVEKKALADPSEPEGQS